MDWLCELGYTHCFFVAGGGIMHLLDGARTRMTCIPVVHEVAAGIAAEYFNESGAPGRAFALVTAGPGVTNIITAMAGAFLESRELLVLAGQVKRPDLASDGIRQRGIQEIDGLEIARPVSVEAHRIEHPWQRDQFFAAVSKGRQGRPGPVFLEVCLDAQGAPLDRAEFERNRATPTLGADEASILEAKASIDEVARLMNGARRPVWLIGGGVSRETAQNVLPDLRLAGVPLMTTWNGADRVPASEPLYVGRPNTWGQRSANILLRQADVIVVFGSRLGLQQTGFNWQEFGKGATVVQYEIDAAELRKGHPKVDMPIRGDANIALRELALRRFPDYSEWLSFCHEVRGALSLNDPANVTRAGYVSPYDFYMELARCTRNDDVIIPCSSGGANSTAMQAYEPKAGQIMVTDKGLASMGYGLSGAIGAALGHRRRTILVEGDGGFLQNLQELATVAVNSLALKIFIFANDGYASIRTTQRNYFQGAYLGCDIKTGLGFPEWEAMFKSFGIQVQTLTGAWAADPVFQEAFDSDAPHAFIVPIDPEQTYFPKITSRVTADGSMESNPLHLMSPDLDEQLARQVFRYLDGRATLEEQAAV